MEYLAYPEYLAIAEAVNPALAGAAATADAVQKAQEAHRYVVAQRGGNASVREDELPELDRAYVRAVKEHFAPKPPVSVVAPVVETALPSVVEQAQVVVEAEKSRKKKK